MHSLKTLVCAIAAVTGSAALVSAEAHANPFYVPATRVGTGIPHAASQVNGFICQDGTCPRVSAGYSANQPAVYPQPITWGPQYGYPQQRPAYPVQQPVYYAPPATTSSPTFEFGQAPFEGAQFSVPSGRIPVRPVPGQSPSVVPRPTPVRTPQTSPVTPSNPFYTAPVREPQLLPAAPSSVPIRENRQPTPSASGQVSGLESPFYP